MQIGLLEVDGVEQQNQGRYKIDNDVADHKLFEID